MRRAEAIKILREHEGELRASGVDGLFLFGSTARDEATRDSDIDLFFDHDEGSLSLFKMMDLQNRAAEILGARTEMVSRRSLHPMLKEGIERSAIQVF